MGSKWTLGRLVEWITLLGIGTGGGLL
jgi:hypothetical protein